MMNCCLIESQFCGQNYQNICFVLFTIYITLTLNIQYMYLLSEKRKRTIYKGNSSKLQNLSSVLLNQGDADYLRYRGMQEFDQAMQHLEEKFGVSLHFPPASPISYELSYEISIGRLSNFDLMAIAHHWR